LALAINFEEIDSCGRSNGLIVGSLRAILLVPALVRKATTIPRSKSALPGVGERPKDSAGALVHDLTKVHGDGEQEYQKEEIDAKK
jgi:hypothetical protein